MCSVPTRMLGGKPVTEMPRLRPRLPVMADAPAAGAGEAATTPNVPAALRFGAVSALTTIVADEALTRILDAGLFGNLLAALDAPNAAVMARATASVSAANLRIRAFIEMFS